MKKLISIFVCVFTVVVSASAQDYEDTGTEDFRKNVVSLGITAGGNYSMMSEYDLIDLGDRTGMSFQGGLAINAHFGQKPGAGAGTGPIGLQLELLYAQHSLKTNLNDDIKLDYLEMPLLFKYYFTKELNVEVGPTFAFLMSKSPDNLVDGSTSIAINELKGGDVRATIGLSYQTGGFFASARYNHGFSELAGNFPCKVSAVTLSVGYLFDVFKF